MDRERRGQGLDSGADNSWGLGYGPGPAAPGFDDRPRTFDQDGPHRGRGPAGWKMSDERLHEEVCERLAHDRWLDATQVGVEVLDGVVTLTGLADSRDDALHAEAIAMRVPGVRRVENRIAEPGHADDDRLGPDAAERARPNWKILPP
ncbi:MAG: BON domain-containing protein [Phenylobacterium sp.]